MRRTPEDRPMASPTQTNEAADGRTRDPHFRQDLKVRVQRRLMETLDLVAAQKLPVQELRDECLRRVDLLLNEQRTPLTTAEKQQLLREVMDEIFGDRKSTRLNSSHVESSY